MPKDSTWSVATIPFRVIIVLVVSLFFIPVIILRRTITPHLNDQLPTFMSTLMFIRFGAYEDGPDRWN